MDHESPLGFSPFFRLAQANQHKIHKFIQTVNTSRRSRRRKNTAKVEKVEENLHEGYFSPFTRHGLRKARGLLTENITLKYYILFHSGRGAGQTSGKGSEVETAASDATTAIRGECSSILFPLIPIRSAVSPHAL